MSYFISQHTGYLKFGIPQLLSGTYEEINASVKCAFLYAVAQASSTRYIGVSLVGKPDSGKSTVAVRWSDVELEIRKFSASCARDVETGINPLSSAFGKYVFAGERFLFLGPDGTQNRLEQPELEFSIASRMQELLENAEECPEVDLLVDEVIKNDSFQINSGIPEFQMLNFALCFGCKVDSFWERSPKGYCCCNCSRTSYRLC